MAGLNCFYQVARLLQARLGSRGNAILSTWERQFSSAFQCDPKVTLNIERMDFLSIFHIPVDDGAEGESVLEAVGHVVDGQAVVGGQLLPEPVQQRVRTEMGRTTYLAAANILS